MIDPEMTLAALVLAQPAAAAVLSRHGLDYCCKGQRSLARAAHEAGLELASLLGELSAAPAEGSAIDPRDRSTPSLIAHIIAAFHDPLRQTLPILAQLAEKVARVHGASESRLVEIDRWVQPLASSLIAHLDQEERDLFPRMMASARTLTSAELDAVLAEHTEMGDALRQIRALSADFQAAPGACNSYLSLFDGLRELEDELFRHVHLENNVLFPRFARS